METRKVYKSGGSTFVMSLPKKWVTKNRLKEGESVFVKETEGALTISVSTIDKKTAKSEIKANNLESSEDLNLLIISHYLVGYNDIVIKFDEGKRLEYKKHIRDVTRFLIGLEIAEEYEDRVILDVVLDQEKIPTPQALKRMKLIIKSMLKDTIEAIKEKNLLLAEDIITREREIDRLYFLIVRQLKSAVRYQETAERLGLSEQREALGFRLVVKSFERTADHIENLIKNYITIASEDLDLTIPLEMLDSTLKIFEESTNSLFRGDQKMASATFKELKEIKEQYHEASDLIFAKELSRPTAIKYKGMIDSLLRIAEYSTDIAEIAINMSVTVP
ncbi:MAG TPA: phosphate uptake regulator PhoU [Euryarchaeota archaeon]|nr:phosphate uptake regulator PhoU [Euryarchaeota archaeon]